jgi:DNA-binding MarR family transcriptional regulator
VGTGGGHAARARAMGMQPATILAEALFIEAVRKAGLTPRQVDVLTAIERARATSQIVLTTAANMDRTTLSKVCRRLVRKGLVRRRRLPEDTRALAVTLTPEGLGVLAEMEAAATHARRAAHDVMGIIEHTCMGPFAASPLIRP